MSITAASRLFVSVLLAISGLLAFTGCAGGPSPVAGQDSIRTLTTLGNSNWILSKWVSADGSHTPIPPPAPTIMIGYQGRLSGQAGVNNYVGNVTVADDRLNWGRNLAVTRMAGPPELMASEARYLADLQATQRVTSRGNRLLFICEKPLRLEFTRANP